MTISSFTMGCRRIPLTSTPELVFEEAPGAESGPVIQPHISADTTRFSDDGSCAVVDEESLANCRARVNVNPGMGVGHLRDDSGNDLHTQTAELMGDAIIRDGIDTRVAENGFSRLLCSGIPFVCGSDGGQETADLRQGGNECTGLLFCSALTILAPVPVIGRPGKTVPLFTCSARRRCTVPKCEPTCRASSPASPPSRESALERAPLSVAPPSRSGPLWMASRRRAKVCRRQHRTSRDDTARQPLPRECLSSPGYIVSAFATHDSSSDACAIPSLPRARVPMMLDARKSPSKESGPV